METIQMLLGLYLSNIKGFPLKRFIINMNVDGVNKKISILEHNLDASLKSWSNEKICQTLQFLDDYYYNGESLVSDATYDKIIDYYKDVRGQEYKKIGAPIKGEKVKLPIHMGSMDKVKPDSSDLKNFFTKFTNNKCIMDKLDGTSLLLDLRIQGRPKAYTRGNGTYGQDISHKINHIMGTNCLSSWKHGGFVRGELIVPKSHWATISSKGKNARNYVSGIVNQKRVIPEELKNITFVAYEWCVSLETGSKENLSISAQLDNLKTGGFNTVKYQTFKEVSEQDLPLILTNYRETSIYEIDGIIVQDDIYHARNTTKNPKYAKAFKMDNMCESKVTTIKEINWEASQDGSLRPTAIFDSVELSGVTISRASAYNAGYVRDNNLGKGAKVKIIRSGEVIPKIIEVLSCNTPDYPETEYVWDANQTHIYLKDKDNNKTVRIKQILYFCKTIDIAFFKEGLISKAFDAGCDSIAKILMLDEQSLQDYAIEGVKSKTSTKIIKSIKSKLAESTLGDFAAATPYFNSMAKKRMNIVNDQISDWLTISKEELYDKISSLSGFSGKTATVIVNGRDTFNTFYNTCQSNGVIISSSVNSSAGIVTPTGDKFKDKVFLFTGFRDKSLKEFIISNGGQVRDTLTKKITHLITPTKDFTNGKVDKATEAGINVINREHDILSN
jgi:DNA ligase (NAD+)